MADHNERTIPALIARGGAADAPAIGSADGAVMRYGELGALIDKTRNDLNALGIGRGHCVAFVAANGPVAATGFLAIASAATCAPLNPGFIEDDFRFYFEDLGAAAVVIEAGSHGAAIVAAQSLEIPIIHLVPEGGAGNFRLEPASAKDGTAEVTQFDEITAEEITAEDIALVLHTSGTTGRPKIVPIRHDSIVLSAELTAASLALMPADHNLNMMPLFHVHGLIGVLMSSLTAGAATIATPGFDAASFAAWVRELDPSWMSAVPTIHQAVLRVADTDPDLGSDAGFRMIRSCSAALPPSVMAGLEAVFGCPVIEAYGMTEAAHQIATNPLPPEPRKPGTVGRAAGPEVAIMNEGADLLSVGEEGEIVLKGDQIMRGYMDNPEANSGAFANSWFRTGDLGRIDSDGYVTITGRIKEVINRGGEKIMPREIDEAILTHPDVAQAVTFPIPHPTLGEAPAAAVVLKEGAATTRADISAHAAARLSPFKVPHRIVLVDEIPKGPTGKVQRLSLADTLDLQEGTVTEYVAPETLTEEVVAGIWASVLGVERVGVVDEFLDLGGDSLLATHVLVEVEKQIGLELDMADILDTPTVAAMAAVVDSRLLEETGD